MFSIRFQRPVVLTRRARMRIAERIVREVSQDWRTHVSFAGDGTVVETVILEASQCGAWPLQMEHKQAA